MSKTKSSIERVFAHFLHRFWQPDVLGECSPHLEVTLNTAMSSHLYDSKLQEDQDIFVLASFPQVVDTVWGFLFITLINGLSSEVFSTFICTSKDAFLACRNGGGVVHCRNVARLEADER